ncbi:type II toxin-antitoxin system VapC family toxin [Zarconia navalis]|uniref:type II toxin-antitoxin system VapC family toxin n=1 Tax=Zarconia navalis TaxID=2992134 RepID=UPI0021F91B11|nr:type II toxin-antitoxin system VapC family toxin [Zarconia navalis]
MGMSYLLDTHILLWWLFDNKRLKLPSRDLIQNPKNNILVSSASAWEIATKYRLGKLPEAKPIVENYAELLTQAKFQELTITSAHALRAIIMRSPIATPSIA